MPTLTIELPQHEAQTVFNLHRWAELLADPELAKFEGRIETDRHGHIIMRPPPAPSLSPSNTEAEIQEKMARYLDAGAKEVWACAESGATSLFDTGTKSLTGSHLCPDFPKQVLLR